MTNKTLYDHTQYLVSVAPQCRGKIGYAVARNIRVYTAALTEYLAVRDGFIAELGTNGQIGANDPNLPVFFEKMRAYDGIENTPETAKVSPADLQSSDLTADVMLALEFMTEVT